MFAKIGIRPVIDGRWGGIREGLEAQTMGLARRAAALIETLRYPDGSPVECVVFGGTIGGAAEAAACAEQFAAEKVCATLTVTPCWCYGTETMDLSPDTLKAVWGFNGTERPGAVYLAAAMAAHAQRGLPAFSIYGRDVQDADDREIPADVADKILRFARCAAAVGWMKNKSYVNIGGVAMGIAGSCCSPAFFQNYLGIRPEWVDMTEILRRVELGIFDQEEYAKALQWVKANCREGKDRNAHPHTAQQKAEDWAFTVKMTLILRDIMEGNPKLGEMGFHEEALGRNAVAAGFQGQRNWTDYKPNGDFCESILNSSFDWNGIREPRILATENDTLNGVAMLFLHMLTGAAAVFADVRTYWSPAAVRRVTGYEPTGAAAGGFIHLLNSGAAALDGAGRMTDGQGKSVMKPWWEVTRQDMDETLRAVAWSPANLSYFRGGGFSSTFSTKGQMPVTLCRINIVDGLGPVLQLAEGYTVELPEEVSDALLERTDPTWPSTWFAPILTGQGAFTDVYSVMANWGANHGAFTYGHVGAELITLASMLRIPVNMHNVDAGRIFRPHAWSFFGTEDREGADFRACRNYGPLYGKTMG